MFLFMIQQRVSGKCWLIRDERILTLFRGDNKEEWQKVWKQIRDKKRVQIKKYSLKILFESGHRKNAKRVMFSSHWWPKNKTPFLLFFMNQSTMFNNHQSHQWRWHGHLEEFSKASQLLFITAIGGRPRVSKNKKKKKNARPHSYSVTIHDLRNKACSYVQGEDAGS